MTNFAFLGTDSSTEGTLQNDHTTNHQSPITNHQSPITNQQSPVKAMPTHHGKKFMTRLCTGSCVHGTTRDHREIK
jgi:hypothetical protein